MYIVFTGGYQPPKKWCIQRFNINYLQIFVSANLQDKFGLVEWAAVFLNLCVCVFLWYVVCDIKKSNIFMHQLTASANLWQVHSFLACGCLLLVLSFGDWNQSVITVKKVLCSWPLTGTLELRETIFFVIYIVWSCMLLKMYYTRAISK